MKEIPKRLKPTPDTMRELFLKSGNMCAFPNCSNLIMNADGEFIAQVCHIEAAMPGGERFNENMSNECRRSPGNLMLMCYEHHIKTNNVDEYRKDKLQVIKADHERKFTDPAYTILSTLTDWTTTDQPVPPRNLARMNKVLDWGLNDTQLSVSLAEMVGYIEVLRLVPKDVRRFVGAIAQRMNLLVETSAVYEDRYGTMILISDVESAFRLSEQQIAQKLTQLESYHLGGLDGMSTSLGNQPAITISHLSSGWPLWLDIICFCQKTDTPLEKITEDLDFSSFDE